MHMAVQHLAHRIFQDGGLHTSDFGEAATLDAGKEGANEYAPCLHVEWKLLPWMLEVDAVFLCRTLGGIDITVGQGLYFLVCKRRVPSG